MVILQEDWVLCRVFQKQKGDGEQDNVRSSSPTFAGCSLASQELPVMDASGEQMGSALGFMPRQEEVTCAPNPLAMNAAMWQQYNSVLLDQLPPEDMVGSSPAIGLAARGDECGFFLDSGFEDMASFGAMRFPQGWS
jgi:hypothetical protein